MIHHGHGGAAAGIIGAFLRPHGSDGRMFVVVVLLC